MQPLEDSGWQFNNYYLGINILNVKNVFEGVLVFLFKRDSPPGSRMKERHGPNDMVQIVWMWLELFC